MSDLLERLKAEVAAGWATVTPLKMHVVRTAPRSKVDERQAADSRWKHWNNRRKASNARAVAATMSAVAEAATPPAVGPAKGVYEEPLGGPPMQTHHTRYAPAPVKVEQ